MNKSVSIRYQYGLCFIGTIILGLLSRSNFIDLPPLIDDYLGDILWGSMIYFLFGFIFSKSCLTRKACFAIIFSFAIELSQLIVSDGFDVLRNLPGMRQVFGYGFRFSDLICYSLGISFAILIDIQLITCNIKRMWSNT